MKSTSICILLIPLLTGCATATSTSTAGSDTVRGMLELRIDAGGSAYRSPHSIAMTIDLLGRSWEPQVEGHTIESCTYRLRGRRLLIDLTSSFQLRTRYQERGDFLRQEITIEGVFTKRDGDYVYGPFSGSASCMEYSRYGDRERELNETTERELWRGTVTGYCAIAGMRVERLEVSW